jgi:seryl-tRNA synthetase
MKKNEIVNVNRELSTLKNLGNTKFMYFVIKNINVLKPHIDPLVEIEKSNKEILSDFEKDRNELIVRLGNKNEDGSYSIDKNNEVMFSEFEEEFKKLTEKHKESLNKFEESFKQLSNVLNEDVEEEIKFRTISIEECPEEGIPVETLELLMKHNLIV